MTRATVRASPHSATASVRAGLPPPSTTTVGPTADAVRAGVLEFGWGEDPTGAVDLGPDPFGTGGQDERIGGGGRERRGIQGRAESNHDAAPFDLHDEPASLAVEGLVDARDRVEYAAETAGPLDQLHRVALVGEYPRDFESRRAATDDEHAPTSTRGRDLRFVLAPGRGVRHARK